MSEQNIQEVNAAVREVLKRSVVDPDFRRLAVKDGKAALAKVSPTLSTSFKMKFVDNVGAEYKTIALPDPIADANLLSEEELEQVAGGCGVSTCGTSKSAE